MFCLGRFLILSFMASGSRKKNYVNEDSDFTVFFVGWHYVNKLTYAFGPQWFLKKLGPSRLPFPPSYFFTWFFFLTRFRVEDKTFPFLQFIVQWFYAIIFAVIFIKFTPLLQELILANCCHVHNFYRTSFTHPQNSSTPIPDPEVVLADTPDQASSNALEGGTFMICRQSRNLHYRLGQITKRISSKLGLTDKPTWLRDMSGRDWAWMIGFPLPFAFTTWAERLPPPVCWPLLMSAFIMSMNRHSKRLCPQNPYFVCFIISAGERDQSL